MASGRKFYTLETRAHRDGYKSKDIDRQTMDGDTYWEETYGAPEILHTSFDTEDVWRRWKSELMVRSSHPSPLLSALSSVPLFLPFFFPPKGPSIDCLRKQNEDLRPSTDAGYYLCDFTYYTSLLEYWRRDPEGERPVMFLHVPGGAGEEDVEKGRKVAVGLIEALVGSLRW